MTAPTAYQRHHRPRRVVEVLCTGRDLDDRGRCATCGRWIPSAEARGRFTHNHRPNERGAFGRIAEYADGSTRYLDPDEFY